MFGTLGGEGACKNSFHRVHIARNIVANICAKCMDAVERGYGPRGIFMARLIQQLTEAKIRTLTKTGLHPDGAGLYLQIRPAGARSWIYRFRLNIRTRDMGLGALADVSLVKARSSLNGFQSRYLPGFVSVNAAHNKMVAAAPAVPRIKNPGK